MFSEKIRIKLFFLLVFIFVAFVVKIYIQSNLEIAKIEEYKKNFQLEKSRRLDDLLELKSKDIEAFSFEATHCDDMVNFVNQMHHKWMISHVLPLLKKYDVTCNWITDSGFSKILSIDSKGDSISSLPLFSNTNFQSTLKEKHFLHFFYLINEDLFEIFCAPIQPSADVERKTTPAGYFMVSKSWNTDYLQSLEELTDARIILHNPQNETVSSSIDSSLLFCKGLYSFDGKEIKTISFSSSPLSLNLIEQIINAQFISNIIFTAVILIVLSVFLFITVIKPINLLLKSISNKNFKYLTKVLNMKTEFRHFAKIIIDNIQQKITMQDKINEKNLILQELELNSTKYRTLFENMTSGLSLNELIFDQSGNPVDYTILEINPVLEKMLMIERKDIIGKTINEINPNWEFVNLELNAKVAIMGVPVTYEAFHKKTNKYYQATVFSPKPLQFALILEDINDRKLSELALQKSNQNLEKALWELKETQNQLLKNQRLQALGQMASGIAHDINNSLAPILGYSDLLLRNHDNNKIFKQLEMIKTASLDIKKTIERLREFYRPKIKEDFSCCVSLNRVIKSAIELTQHRWKAIPESEGNTIVIKTNFERDLPTIRGSESEIREAITNLIINACDAMENNGNLNFTTYSNNNKIFFELKDNGCGMDENIKANCLDPFFSTKGNKGTGLGLSMVFGIVKRHEGDIEIESALNIGTTIRLIFPAEVSAEMTQTNNSETIINTLKILVIDDDIAILEIIKTILSEINHDVTAAASGEEGLNIFTDALNSNSKFDLVISDLGMPKMNGREVIQKLKMLDDSIPTILLTGWNSFDENDMNDIGTLVLNKPITTSELYKAINSIFGNE